MSSGFVLYPTLGKKVRLSRAIKVKILTVAKHSETDQTMVVLRVCGTRHIFTFTLEEWNSGNREAMARFMLIYTSEPFCNKHIPSMRAGSKYEHYKGGIYRTIALTKGAENGLNTWLVVYKSLLFGSIHVRPMTMWHEGTSGGMRFTLIKEEGSVRKGLRDLYILWTGHLKL